MIQGDIFELFANYTKKKKIQKFCLGISIQWRKKKKNLTKSNTEILL